MRFSASSTSRRCWLLAQPGELPLELGPLAAQRLELAAGRARRARPGAGARRAAAPARRRCAPLCASSRCSTSTYARSLAMSCAAVALGRRLGLRVAGQAVLDAGEPAGQDVAALVERRGAHLELAADARGRGRACGAGPRRSRGRSTTAPSAAVRACAARTACSSASSSAARVMPETPASPPSAPEAGPAEAVAGAGHHGEVGVVDREVDRAAPVAVREHDAGEQPGERRLQAGQRATARTTPAAAAPSGATVAPEVTAVSRAVEHEQQRVARSPLASSATASRAVVSPSTTSACIASPSAAATAASAPASISRWSTRLPAIPSMPVKQVHVDRGARRCRAPAPAPRRGPASDRPRPRTRARPARRSRARLPRRRACPGRPACRRPATSSATLLELGRRRAPPRRARCAAHRRRRRASRPHLRRPRRRARARARAASRRAAPADPRARSRIDSTRTSASATSPWPASVSARSASSTAMSSSRRRAWTTASLRASSTPCSRSRSVLACSPASSWPARWRRIDRSSSTRPSWRRAASACFCSGARPRRTSRRRSFRRRRLPSVASSRRSARSRRLRYLRTPAASSMTARRSSGREFSTESSWPCPTMTCCWRPMPVSERSSWMSSRRHGAPLIAYSESPVRNSVRVIVTSENSIGSRLELLSIVSETSARPSAGRSGVPGEDDVVHLPAAQRARALGAEHPRDRVDEVGLPRAVRPDDDHDAGLELEHGLVRERLEPLAGSMPSGTRAAPSLVSRHRSVER